MLGCRNVGVSACSPFESELSWHENHRFCKCSFINLSVVDGTGDLDELLGGGLILVDADAIIEAPDGMLAR